MHSVAKALVYLCEYVDLRNDDDYTEEDDIEATRYVAELLENCSAEEKKALKSAAKELAKEEENDDDPNEEIIDDYKNWKYEYGLEEEKP
jgi:hypothetical protein